MKTKLLFSLLVATLVFALPHVLAQAPLAVQVTSPPPAPLLEVLSPLPGAKIDKDTLTVRYQLKPLAPPTENSELILDDRDPVHTTETEYTFTGLKPGPHRLIVEAVDANNMPIAGTRNEIRFFVVQSSTPPPAPHAALGGSPASYSVAARPAPNAVSPLPLLLIIGVGMVVGGLVSARRTRPASR
jgi:hypothetical protein